MIPQRYLLSLLLSPGMHGLVVRASPDDGSDVAGTNLNILEESLSEEAGTTIEGRERIAQIKGLMQQVASRTLPNANIYWDENRVGYEGCFYARYPMRQADVDQVGVRIKAKDIEDLDSGDEYTVEQIITTVKSAIKTQKSDTSMSDQEKESWEAGGSFKLGPLKGLSLGGNLKYSSADTTVRGTTTSFTNKGTDEDKIAQTSRDVFKCETGHYCRLQLWTYETTFKGSAPLVPMMRTTCVLENHAYTMDRDRNSTGKIYGGVMEQIRRRGAWWYTGKAGRYQDWILGLPEKIKVYKPRSSLGDAVYFLYWGFPSTCYASHIVGCGVAGEDVGMASLHGNMPWWDQEHSKYYRVTQEDGSPATLPNVPIPVDGTMPNWPRQISWYDFGPEDERDYLLPVGPQHDGGNMPSWQWASRDAGNLDGVYNVEFLQKKPWSMSFPTRNPDGKIMSTVVIVKTPYDDANEKRAERNTTSTIQVLHENIDLDFADYL
ncbi:hypothetical protein J3458_015179 [Metarhizium acridum]|uniref:uncharacterized protein n=1 Tax=Metarhizium acridum TaxID=92637 RepID=UPI001C6CC562|nr:hypothetical protein J3458_015179 [Metarhizium acridum]